MKRYLLKRIWNLRKTNKNIFFQTLIYKTEIKINQGPWKCYGIHYTALKKLVALEILVEKNLLHEKSFV